MTKKDDNYLTEYVDSIHEQLKPLFEINNVGDWIFHDPLDSLCSTLSDYERLIISKFEDLFSQRKNGMVYIWTFKDQSLSLETKMKNLLDKLSFFENNAEWKSSSPCLLSSLCDVMLYLNHAEKLNIDLKTIIDFFDINKINELIEDKQTAEDFKIKLLNLSVFLPPANVQDDYTKNDNSYHKKYGFVIFYSHILNLLLKRFGNIQFN